MQTSKLKAKCLGVFVSLLAGLCCPAFADVRLPAPISDHMVLQQNAPVRIWGWSKPGEAVTVAFQGQSAAATADAEGRWCVWLKALKPAASADLTVTGENRIVVHDVLVGEVWVASGQSNMERAVHFSQNLDAVQAHAFNPQLRLFHADHAVSAHPAEDIKGSWEIADSKTILNFAATAYFFGQKLQQETHQPVGLIESAYGGTPIESWMSAESLARNPSLAFVQKEWDEVLAGYPDAMKAYQQKFDVWKKGLSVEDRKAVENGKMLPGAPVKPRGAGSQAEPSGLYNGMIAPLTPYSIRGIVWYQGENNNKNAHEAYHYRDLFVAMIRDWRAAWGEGDLPFLFMQLARYRSNGLFPMLRESQSAALALANTGMVVTADAGMVGDVHYPDKETVGARLLLAVRKVAYHEPVAASGPRLRQVTSEKNSLRLWFDEAESGLQLKPVPLPVFAPLTPQVPPERIADGKAVEFVPVDAEASARAFLIAGRDGIFFPAQTVMIDGQSLLLRSERVQEPTQVCYAWDDKTPAMLLWNGAGLPASPFRAALEPRLEPACPDGASRVEE